MVGRLKQREKHGLRYVVTNLGGLLLTSLGLVREAEATHDASLLRLGELSQHIYLGIIIIDILSKGGEERIDSKLNLWELIDVSAHS